MSPKSCTTAATPQIHAPGRSATHTFFRGTRVSRSGGAVPAPNTCTFNRNELGTSRGVLREGQKSAEANKPQRTAVRAEREEPNRFDAIEA